MTAARAGADRAARIEQLITCLVQTSPGADAAVVDELGALLGRVGSPLARSIARVLELVVEQRIAPGIALPPLAMACATLAGGVRGAFGERELEAARFEIETLLPNPSRIDRFRSAAEQGSESPCGEGSPCGVPDRPPAIAAPDVPVSALRRRG